MNHPFEILPLTIEARGEVISSNIDEFRELVREALANINRDLKTDEEFGQAELDTKALKGAEDTVKAAKDKALQDAESLHALFATLDTTSEEIRTARLDLETQIKKRKEEVKTELVEDALATFDIDPSLARKQFQQSLKGQMSGKRTLDSMRKALRIYATTQQEMIKECRAILDSFEAAHGLEMTMDRRTLELEKPEGLKAELRRRFEAKKAADERKRLEEDAAKARAEAAKSMAAAEEAIRQAEAAKQPAKPSSQSMPAKPEPLPAPPKIGSIPTGAKAAPADESNVVPFSADSPLKDPAAEEWAAFKSAILTSFGPLKAAKQMLRHPANIERASAFAQAVNAAWNAMKESEVVK